VVLSSYYEYVGNLHAHTPYSDGEGSHSTIAKAAQAAGLDFVVATDHNILVKGVEGYYGDDTSGYVLLLTGEEIHDRTRQPQSNHLLAYGLTRELAQCAADPQVLIDTVGREGGLSFLAHPHDPDMTRIRQMKGIPWTDWQVERYTGLEIWNYMSSFKGVLTGSLVNIGRAVFRPEEAITAPDPATLALWDELLGQGKRIVGIGGSDAHGIVFRLGLFEHIVFPYDFLFSCVNTHVVASQPFSGDWERDQATLYRAIQQGNTFIGYDLLGSTRGFRFTANGQNSTTILGGSIRLGPGVTLQALAYERSHFKIIRHGKIVAEASGVENLTYTAREPGAYRVEVWREFKGRERAWILSNPIYVEDSSFSAR
jgi:hypothetical protein